jgi:hypothetical protein
MKMVREHKGLTEDNVIFGCRECLNFRPGACLATISQKLEWSSQVT